MECIPTGWNTVKATCSWIALDAIGAHTSCEAEDAMGGCCDYEFKVRHPPEQMTEAERPL